MYLFITIVLGVTLVTASIVGCAILSYKTKVLERDMLHKEGIISIQESQIEEESKKYKKLLSQKKSSETRLGQISEHLVPFLKNCPYDPKQMQFLGNPLDYIVFDADEGKIVFLEIKSGNSRTSKKQRTLKNIIEAGHVYYEEIRIDEKGVKIRKSKNAK